MKEEFHYKCPLASTCIAHKPAGRSDGAAAPRKEQKIKEMEIWT